VLNKIHVIVLVFLIILALGVSTLLLLRRLLVDDMEATYRMITGIQFQCPDGTTDTIDRWGKAGYMRFCQRGEVKDGPWTAWETQYKNVEGEYKYGRKHGSWIWWNKNGSKHRVIEYREGAEIRDEIPQSHERTEKYLF
jgi:hypothetical protein